MRTRRFAIGVLAVLVIAGLVGSAFALSGAPRRDFTEPAAPAPAQTEYVIVTLKDPPAASYAGGIDGLAPTKPARGQRLDPSDPRVQAYVSHLGQAHQDYRHYLASKAPKAEIVREYFYVANGFAIRLHGTRPQVLAAGPGARTVTFSTLVRPTMNVSTGLISAGDLWQFAGGRENAGRGIKVGIIDSGIDPTHPFFACKDTDGDGLADIPAKVYASGVVFDPTNVLVFDHGTHVAGTVAGCVTELTEGPITGFISGVAPGARVYDYNVFPGFGAGYVAFGGAAFSHDIIAALEDTVVDGMHVVNMSLGGGVEGPHDILAEAVNATADAGLVVAVAAGNSGPGDSTISSPGSAAKALTAGASTNPHFIGIRVAVTAPVRIFGAALGEFNNFVPALEDVPYTVTDPANGCAVISTDLSGKIALIDRGACTFTTKIRNAQARGAMGVLIVNNAAGDPVAMGHDGTDPFPTIPAAMVSRDDGGAMKPSGTVTVDGTTVGEFITGNADLVAGFSSRGPTPFTYLIKPDVTAPGVNVYSSVFEGEFAMFQGTSMATPHLAGSAALLLHLHPDWSPADVKSALVNTAARVVTDHVTGKVDPGVLARGGGRIDLAAAGSTPLTFDPASASFGYWRGNKPVTAALDLTVRNVSGSYQACSVTLTGPEIVTASTAAIGLDDGATTTLTLYLDAGRANQTGSGDHGGDVFVDCDGTELRVPWWVRIDRQATP